jgi:hypothetical protein
MEKKVAVLHQGKLAQYSIKEEKNGRFIARLFNYSGRYRDQPPSEIELHKVGRHWEDEGASQDLVDDIGNAIEHERGQIQKPVYHQRGNNNPSEGNIERSSRTIGGKPS